MFKVSKYLVLNFWIFFSITLLIFSSNLQAQKFTQLTKGNIRNFGEVMPINNQLFFSVDGQVWKTDGTVANTKMVKNLGVRYSNQPSNGARPNLLVQYKNNLIFSADTKEYGEEYWITDGSEAGTRLIKDLRTGKFWNTVDSVQNNGVRSDKSKILVLKDKVFLLGAGEKDRNFSPILWSSDGTESGTSKVFEFGSSEIDIFINRFFKFDDNRFLISLININKINNNLDRSEIWTSDGTKEGTKLLKSFPKGTDITYEDNFKVINGQAFFKVYNVDKTTDLWKTDGTPNGTARVMNIENLYSKYAGLKAGGGISDFTVIGDRMYFFGDYNQILFETDGTENGTILIDKAITSYAIKNGRIVYTLIENGKNTLKIIKESKKISIPLDDSFKVVTTTGDETFLVLYANQYPISTYKIKESIESLVNLGFSQPSTIINSIGSDIFMAEKNSSSLKKVSGSPEIILRDHAQYSDFFLVGDKLIYVEKFSDANNRIFALEKGVNANPVDCKKFTGSGEVIKGPKVLCGGSSAELILQSSGNAFRWLKDGLEVNTFSQIGPQGLKINGPGQYKVTVALSNQCSIDYGPHIVSDKSDLKALISFEEGLRLCPQNKPYLRLNGRKIGGISPFQYIWKLDNQIFQQTSPVTNIENDAQINKEGKYTFLVIDKDNCRDSVSINIKTGESLIKPAITATGTTIKTNEGVTLSTNIALGELSSLQWYKDGNKVIGENNKTLIVKVAGKYSVSIYEPLKCETFSDQLEIKDETNGSNIIASIKNDSPNSVYFPSTVKLSAQTGTGYTYQWQKDGINIQGATSSTYEAKESGTYKVIVTLNGVSKSSNEIKVTILTVTINSVITSSATEAYSPNTIKLSASSGTGYTYQWQKDGVNVPGATLSSYDAKESGTYRVIVSVNGVSKTSNEIVVTIKTILANEPFTGSGISIYPNPSSEFVTLKMNNFDGKLSKIEVYSSLGRLVKELETVKNEHLLDVKDLSTDTYLIKVIQGKNTYSSKFIKL